MANEVFMLVLSIGLDRSWWSIPVIERKNSISKVEEVEKKFSNDFVSLKRFASITQGSQVIYWVSSTDTSKIVDFRDAVMSSFEGYAYEHVSLFSVFKPSPYMKGGGEIEKALRLPPLRYFIAYPMKKSVDWYLLPFEEREKVMREHIEIARTHPKNNGIRSYTTYSFGIADYEFVVIYEAPSLIDWVDVVEKLREAKARKWVTKEEPILVGELKGLEHLLY